MTFEQFFQSLSFDEQTERAYGRVCITGTFVARASQACARALFASNEREARDYFQHSIAKKIYDMLIRELCGYSVDELHYAYEMGARDGMWNERDNFDAVRAEIDRRKGRA